MITVLCDMDGVLCDFVPHALRLHGIEEVKITSWNIEEQLGITKDQFKNPINKQGERFWRSMPESPGWRVIWDLCCGYADEAYICSSPAKFKGACDGKVSWATDRLGKEFNRFVFTRHKHLLAGPDKILVDDCDENVNDFRKHGGYAILFPQAWNSMGDISEKTGYLEEELEKTVKKIRRYQEASEKACESCS